MIQLLQYTFCFAPDTFQGRDAVQWVEADRLGFPPQRVLASNAFWLYQPYQPGDLAPIAMEGSGVNLTLWAREQEGGLEGDQRYFHIHELGTEQHGLAQMIRLRIAPEELGQIPLIDDLLTHPRLRAAYCCDEEDHWMQNADSPTAYQVRGRSYAHLDVYFDEEWVEEKIDISHNPGRSTFVHGYELSSCWRMWFGPSFFELVSAEHLLAFPQARRAERTDRGHVFIELYADPFEADLPEHRKAQQAFRDWIKLEELTEQLKQAEKQVNS